MHKTTYYHITLLVIFLCIEIKKNTHLIYQHREQKPRGKDRVREIERRKNKCNDKIHGDCVHTDVGRWFGVCSGHFRRTVKSTRTNIASSRAHVSTSEGMLTHANVFVWLIFLNHWRPSRDVFGAAQSKFGNSRLDEF